MFKKFDTFEAMKQFYYKSDWAEIYQLGYSAKIDCGDLIENILFNNLNEAKHKIDIDNIPLEIACSTIMLYIVDVNSGVRMCCRDFRVVPTALKIVEGL